MGVWGWSSVSESHTTSTDRGDTPITIDVRSDTNGNARMSSHREISRGGSEAIFITGVDSFMEKKLYAYALQNMWNEASSIYDQYPGMIRIPLTVGGDTALHVAVTKRNTNFVKNLVTSEHMTPLDLEIRNADGNTAFGMAVITGNNDVLETMMEKNENLPVIPGQDGMLPVHLAALFGYHKIAQDLSSKMLHQNLDFNHIQRLFFMAINSSLYDMASKLVEKYPETLCIARDGEEKLTALHMLARKSSEQL
ncbi:uncharacterized protein LOC130717545 isoform X4 [Lotus japonicus]|nr:uncharacterized protein LOC130717545 isoform X4 [Lotus japonicus]